MSYPTYGPVENFSPLDNHQRAIYRSPASYSEPFQPIEDQDHGDLGAGIEMGEGRPILPPRPNQQLHHESSNTVYSTSSTLFSGGENQSFLHDPINKIDSVYAANAYQPYRDNSKRQFWHIFLQSTFRWLITAGLCIAYAIMTIIWEHKGPQDENSKKLFNAITTGISIALGLNIASAFKDMAVNMRWLILSNRKRNLVEADLILSAESLSKLTRLVFVSRRPVVILCCIAWLLLNLAAQAGIAMLSLTYNFNPDVTAVQLKPGQVSMTDLTHFYPIGNITGRLTEQDEKYTAHLYGQLGGYYGISPINDPLYPLPIPGHIYNESSMVLWSDVNNTNVKLYFVDSPTNQSMGTYSVYTDRILTTSWDCYSVEMNDLMGTSGSKSFDIPGVGNITIPMITSNATTFFTNADNQCGSRCSIVEALEISSYGTFYYTCNITMDNTENDPDNHSLVSDSIALIATSSIAQSGYPDSSGRSTQIYPLDTFWGAPVNGSEVDQGYAITSHAMGAIAGMMTFNPMASYDGLAPEGGQVLQVGHHIYFYLILALICITHLILCLIVAVRSNKVMVGPDGHLSMSMLLRPIADSLYGVSNGKENKAFRDAKQQTQVRYEKGNSGRWHLNMLP